MASTNKTSNLELSQFIATDTPTWLVDYNGDMEKIDAGVGRVEELAETASTQAVGVASGLQTTNQTVTTLSGQVANVQNQANTTTASVNGINQRLGNADISGIADGTITGAISMQNSNLKYVKLWTNPNSNVDFVAQTLEIDLTSYDYIDIDFKLTGSINNSHETKRYYKGSESSSYFTFSGIQASRAVTMNNSGVVFGDAYNGSSVENIRLVPYAIYGGKVSN